MPKVQPEVYCRPPWQRMMRIHEILQKGRYPNCTCLAEEFEVSSRTVKRDVDFMKCRLNLPIEDDAKRNGYYYTVPVLHLPAISITEAEIFALLVAQKAITQYQGTPFHQPLEAAFRKLSGQLDGACASPWAAWTTCSPSGLSPRRTPTWMSSRRSLAP